MSDLKVIAQMQHAVSGYGAEPILKGVDLELEQGTITGLLGRNGSGKTTLMRTLVGLIKPSLGEAQIFGESSYISSSRARRRLGYVSQEAVDLGVLRNVREVVYAFSQFYPTWDKAQSDKRMQDWGLASKSQSRLSTGERQKVSLLLGMGHNPDFLVLDEPVSSLDPAARRDFMSELVDQNIVKGQTVLLSSHITSDIERIASHVAIVRDGEVVLHRELDELREFTKLVTFNAGSAESISDVEGLFVRFGNQAWIHCESDTLLRNEVARSGFSLEEFFLAMTDQAAALPPKVKK